ncbi:MAG TPA: flagellar export chaperone FliS [Verrucomicrobiae bacterium]|nr:flagellar export chaperone FliS [Verrucomicrobiae bacterium]
MNQEDIASLYRQVSVTVASPTGMVVKLYDRILEDFRHALEANAAGNVERRVSSLNHALLIIAELEGVLDFERGGAVAKHLQGFYRVARSLILEANVRASQVGIEKLRDIFTPLRNAWQQVDQDVARNQASMPEEQAPQPREMRRQTIAAEPELEAAGSRWSA